MGADVVSVHKSQVKTDIFSPLFFHFKENIRKNMNCRVVVMTTMTGYFMLLEYRCIELNVVLSR